MQGLHLTADCHHCSCDAALLVDAAALLQLCLNAVKAAGLQAVNQLAHQFPAVDSIKSGVTATILLAESHLCIHTWPEIQAVTLDVYVCNFGGDHSAKAHHLMDALLAAFKPETTDRHELHRGRLTNTENMTTTTKALILAAGRGERMRPLTDHTPKPLLEVRGQPLMQWAMQALAAGGFTDFVINTAWLGEKISTHFGEKIYLKIGLQPSYLLTEQLLKSEQKKSGKEDDSVAVNIRYSHEGRDFGGALETAGGIVRALPMLCHTNADDVFWVLAGDVFAPDFVFSQDAVERFKASGKLAHIWLVANPEHNLKGDFGLQADGLVINDAPEKFTFSTIALYHKSLFSLPYCDIPAGNPDGVKAALAPLLRKAIAAQQVSGELYRGTWTDVGTPERLAQLNAISHLA